MNRYRYERQARLARTLEQRELEQEMQQNAGAAKEQYEQLRKATREIKDELYKLVVQATEQAKKEIDWNAQDIKDAKDAVKQAERAVDDVFHQIEPVAVANEAYSAAKKAYDEAKRIARDNSVEYQEAAAAASALRDAYRQAEREIKDREKKAQE